MIINVLLPLSLIRRILLMWRVLILFMLVDHERNALYHNYIVEFIHDATESYYEKGKHGSKHFNIITFPLFKFKVFKLLLFYLPMLLALFFNDLFSYKISMHRKWVRLK